MATTTRPRPCRRKCAGRNVCMCNAGHRAPCICGDPTCACHEPQNYGLALNRRGRYVPEQAAPDTARTLAVPL
jgi:hypothetical protein